jgi:AcrR family transcriptional regulator
VGVTKQTLLYHYPSKDALRRAVIEGVFSHWRTRLPQMLEAVTSGHGRFEALTLELITFFENDADRALVILRELLDNPEEMRRLVGDNLRPWTLLLAQYIREGQRIDLIHADVDPEAYVLNVIGLVLANVVSRPLVEAMMTGGGVTREEVRGRQTQELFRLTRTALFKR